MLGTEIASAVLTSERQERLLSTFLAYHCSIFTRLQLFEEKLMRFICFYFNRNCFRFVLFCFSFFDELNLRASVRTGKNHEQKVELVTYLTNEL